MATGDSVSLDTEQGAVVLVPTAGNWLVGGFLGYRAAKSRTVNGTKFENWDVGLLVDGELIAVQYGSEAEAREAVGAAAGGDVIALRVVNRYGVKDGRPWQFYVGHRSGSTLDAAEFAA